MTQSVRTSTRVAVDPARAFQIFTDEIGAWWRRDERYQFQVGQAGRLSFEDGHLVEQASDGSVFTVGEVLVWEPPKRLIFEFRAAKFEAGEVTEVEVNFEIEGEGTRVTVEHRGWESIGAKHPARHGMFGPAFKHLMGAWWGDLLQALQQHESAS